MKKCLVSLALFVLGCISPEGGKRVSDREARDSAPENQLDLERIPTDPRRISCAISLEPKTIIRHKDDGSLELIDDGSLVTKGEGFFVCRIKWGWRKKGIVQYWRSSRQYEGTAAFGIVHYPNGRYEDKLFVDAMDDAQDDVPTRFIRERFSVKGEWIDVIYLAGFDGNDEVGPYLMLGKARNGLYFPLDHEAFFKAYYDNRAAGYQVSLGTHATGHHPSIDKEPSK